MASESIGAIYSTQIPGYADNADVQEAFRLYHYGSAAYNTANSNVANLVNPSVAYTLNDLQTQIDGISPIDLGIINAKGDLLVGLANDSADNLTVGSNNYVLTADSAETLGVKWAPPIINSTLTTAGDILYASAANVLARIGIGTEGKVLTVTNGIPAWGDGGSASLPDIFLLGGM